MFVDALVNVHAAWRLLKLGLLLTALFITCAPTSSQTSISYFLRHTGFDSFSKHLNSDERTRYMIVYHRLVIWTSYGETSTSKQNKARKRESNAQRFLNNELKHLWEQEMVHWCLPSSAMSSVVSSDNLIVHVCIWLSFAQSAVC